ncbi:MAG: type II toxin-antitoxin system HicA family toxin [Pelistega sp.]|nr:type II toxin-antitoxin system HicA family toxin [Pelistega sp.]
MKSSEVIRILQRNGWRLIRIKGSHHHFKKEGIPFLITISHPKKDVSIGQLEDIQKKAGIKF